MKMRPPAPRRIPTINPANNYSYVSDLEFVISDEQIKGMLEVQSHRFQPSLSNEIINNLKELTGDRGCAELQFDSEKVRYVSVLNKDGGEPIVKIQYSELSTAPELIEGFMQAAMIFTQTPENHIRRGGYDMLIENGATRLSFLVVDPVEDKAPYRLRLKWIHDFAEDLSFPKGQSKILEMISHMQMETPLWIHYHLLQCLLSSLGMSWIGFLDGNPIKHLEYIVPRIGQLFGPDEIQKYVTGNILQQIDTGGTTIGLDIDTAKEHGEFAKRIKQVLAKRQSEISEVKVSIDHQSANLKNLWLTSYGFNVLNAVNAGISCNLESFHQLEKEFAKNDITIKTVPRSFHNNSGVSRGLQEYIWELVEYGSDAPSPLTSNLLKRFIELIMI